MTDEIQAELAVIPAPEQAETAPPAPDISTPEATETAIEDKPVEKVFTQAELDAKISKRLAAEERKWKREQAARIAEIQAAQKVPTENVSVDQFESPEAYARVLAEKIADERIEQREIAKQRSQIVQDFSEREEAAREKYDDYDMVAHNSNLHITEVMADAIRHADIGPEVFYHLGLNPKKAEQISKLPPFLQAKEIGKLEAKLAAEPPVKKTSSAPAPISPVSARGVGTLVTDTTDPRSIKTLSTSDWIEAERKRQIEKYKKSLLG